MFCLRKIKSEDAEDILRIRNVAVMETKESALLYSPEILQAWTSILTPETIERERIRICGDEFIALGVEVDLELVCFGRLDLQRKNLRQLYCKPAFQRCGYARQVLKALEDRAAEAGLSVLELTASLVGKPFYLKMGYQPMYEYDFILRGDVKMPCLMMNKRL